MEVKGWCAMAWHATDEEHEALRRAARSGDLSLRSRARALVLHVSGKSYRAIQAEQGISKTTMVRWVGWFREGGVSALKDRRWVRRRPVLLLRVQEAVPSFIHQSPQQFGIERSHWTVADIQRVLSTQGVVASGETVRRSLHRMGLHWKRAKRTISSPDPEYERKRGRSKRW